MILGFISYIFTFLYSSNVNSSGHKDISVQKLQWRIIKNEKCDFEKIDLKILFSNSNNWRANFQKEQNQMKSFRREWQKCSKNVFSLAGNAIFNTYLNIRLSRNFVIFKFQFIFLTEWLSSFRNTIPQFLWIPKIGNYFIFVFFFFSHGSFLEFGNKNNFLELYLLTSSTRHISSEIIACDCHSTVTSWS